MSANKTRFMPMKGNATFNSFAFLRKAAENAFVCAKENPRGSNYERISAVLFSAFSIEAHLNHIGKHLVHDWETKEREFSWRDKLALVAKTLGFKAPLGSRPFQTVASIFELRDRLAHGKTETYQMTYKFREDQMDAIDPPWLAKYWSDAAVQRVMDDTWKIMETMQEKARLPMEAMCTIGRGEFEAVPRGG
jgi:hypothetical protein